MNYDYELIKNLYEVTLENNKKVKISKKFVDNSIDKLGISEADVIQMWLEDEGYLHNEEQDNLDTSAKGKVKLVAKSEDKPKQKTQKERVQKANPTKELIISTIAQTLEKMQVDNLNVENKAKLITFSLNNEDYKIDLVQKRKPKA